MKVIVTGGAGRLGRSTVAALAAEGHEVISVDRSPVAGVDSRDLDLLVPGAFAGLVAAERPDAVVHLAAIAVPFSAPEGVILDVNAKLAFTVLDAAREHGVPRVLAASSPTVIGYGSPGGWSPDYLPIDEAHPTRPWNAYSLSKQLVENMVAMFSRQGSATVFGAFRPCFVVSPEEWQGEPTQQGHTIVERLNDPSLAAVALFNYVDARDAAAFVARWLQAATAELSGEVFFVGADDALALAPLAELLPLTLPGTADVAAGLTGSSPAFSSARAASALGWRPARSWRTELAPDQTALLHSLTSESQSLTTESSTS
jgi:UDP-glucose 4-epimerase